MVVFCVQGTIDRFHGFLRSILLNIHPGVYVSVDLDSGSRQRVWDILCDWYDAAPQGTVLMMYRDKSKPMGIALESLGAPKRSIVEQDGHYLLLHAAKQARPRKTTSLERLGGTVAPAHAGMNPFHPKRH